MPVVESFHVARTLLALEILALQPRSAPELAEALDPPVHVRTARRVLKRLQAEGYVVMTPGPRRRYRTTLRVVALAGVALANSDITKAAAPQLASLQKELGLGSCLCVPSLLSTLCVAHLPADSTDGCQPGLRGRLVPCHATASGKVLLAWRDRWCEEVLRQPLERFTERTMTGEYLRRALQRSVRAFGFAVEDREFETNTRAVAAPVFDHTEDAVAAVTVVGALEQLPTRDLADVGRIVKVAATALSEELGYRRQ